MTKSVILGVFISLLMTSCLWSEKKKLEDKLEESSNIIEHHVGEAYDGFMENPPFLQLETYPHEIDSFVTVRLDTIINQQGFEITDMTVYHPKKSSTHGTAVDNKNSTSNFDMDIYETQVVLENEHKETQRWLFSFDSSLNFIYEFGSSY